MSGPCIGDRAMYYGDRGELFEGVVMGIRPKREWVQPDWQETHSGYLTAPPPPEGDFVFLATLGWPHMAIVAREEYDHRDDRGRWRAPLSSGEGTRP